VEVGVVEVVDAGDVVEGSRVAGVGVVGGGVVTRFEGVDRAAVERARDESRQTQKAIWSEAILS
jgi:hypothetical protein